MEGLTYITGSSYFICFGVAPMRAFFKYLQQNHCQRKFNYLFLRVQGQAVMSCNLTCSNYMLKYSFTSVLPFYEKSYDHLILLLHHSISNRVPYLCIEGICICLNFDHSHCISYLKRISTNILININKHLAHSQNL